MIRQNYLKVVALLIITDQWNQISRLYELQVTVIYSRAIVVTVASESSVRWFLKKLDQNTDLLPSLH